MVSQPTAPMMYELRCLGAPGLAAPDDDITDALVRQPERFALLVYLACRRPEPRLETEAFMPVFWPGSGEERALEALWQSLYVIGSILGGDVLTVRDERWIEIDRSRLACDVWSFRSAVEAEEWEAAVAVRKGTFLEGFTPLRMPAFARWARRMRKHLDAIAARAWVEVAVEAEASGRADDVVTALRGALETAPYNEFVIRRLVRTLQEQGDRAEAVAEYTAFARRLRIDLDIEPTTATRHHVRDLLSRRSGASASYEGEASDVTNEDPGATPTH